MNMRTLNKIFTSSGRSFIVTLYAFVLSITICQASEVNDTLRFYPVDLTYAENFILGKWISDEHTYYFNRCDIDMNGVIDGVDLNNIINIVLEKKVFVGDSVIHTNYGYEFKMIKVEGGLIDFGDGVIHEINDFLIMEAEMTNELYRETGGSHEHNVYLNAAENIYIGLIDEEGNEITKEYLNNCPCYIRNMNYLRQYINKLTEFFGLRLPTVEEWLYAARGGKYSKGYKYAGSDNIDEVAWYKENCNTINVNCVYPYYFTGYYDATLIHGIPNPVKTKKPNELGLYDMSGNAAEAATIDSSTYPYDNGHIVVLGGSAHSGADDCVPGIANDPAQYYVDRFSYYNGLHDSPCQPCLSLGIRLVMPLKSGAPTGESNSNIESTFMSTQSSTHNSIQP